MGVLDRAGNLLKGFLRKPLEALEKSPEERQLDRELEDKAALERARANIDELDRTAGPVPESKTKTPAAKPEPSDDDGTRKKRRMGPD
jgi:hypothetical protein